jgi:hypothetical protein
MKRLALTLTAAALVVGMTALTASAQTQSPGAATLHAQANGFTPIVRQTACNGRLGPWCGPGLDTPLPARAVRRPPLPLRALLLSDHTSASICEAAFWRPRCFRRAVRSPFTKTCGAC